MSSTAASVAMILATAAPAIAIHIPDRLGKPLNKIKSTGRSPGVPNVITSMGELTPAVMMKEPSESRSARGVSIPWSSEKMMELSKTKGPFATRD
jgi:hypothetical protein